MPDRDPEHYFSEWTDEEFHDWLHRALDVLIPKLHLLPEDILRKLHGFREVAFNRGFDAEPDVKWLYSRMEEAFDQTRQDLGIR